MKRIFIILIVLAVACPVSAQMVPHASQMFQLAPAYNPAFTGIEDFTSIKIGYRSQWSSFAGAPKFLQMVGHGRLKQPANVTHNALKTGRTIDETQIPRLKRMIHGIGATLVHETNGAGGALESTEGGLMYAAHYPLTRKMYFAAGISAHYGNTRIRLDKINTQDPDPWLETAAGSAITNLNVRTGVLLYAPRFYLHAAYLQTYVDNETGSLSGDVRYRYRYRMSGGMGVRMNLNATTELRPAVAMLMDSYDNLILDYSLKAYFGNKIWGGGSYRDSGFAAVMVGFELNALLGVSYAYETSTGGLQGFNSGSNEIILGLKLANLQKVNPYVW